MTWQCVRCSMPIGPGGLQFHPATGRCLTCEQNISLAYREFLTAFHHVIDDQRITATEWSDLQRTAERLEIPWDRALEYVRPAAFEFAKQALVLAVADGGLSDDAYRQIGKLCDTMQLDAQQKADVLRRGEVVRLISRVREGDLPQVKTPRGLVLDPDELCHFALEAAWDSGDAVLHGRLVLTSKQLQLVAHPGGFSLLWSAIRMVEIHGSSELHVQTIDGARSGSLHLELAALAGEIILQRVRAQRNR